MAAERPEQSRAERSSIDRVLVAVEGKDCARAVSRLNDGLADKYPGIYLLAGSMYEEGICLKPNWERAVQMYQRAEQLGHRGGLFKLVAGYAYRERDPALALWWAQQSQQLSLPGPCRIAEWVQKDAAALETTLRAWPPARLAACNYTAGVLATVAGDAEYPHAAISHALAGKVEMTFVPAAGTLAWRTLDVEERPLIGLINATAAADRTSRDAKASLETYMREVGERALRRFVRPASIDPDWRLTYVFEFRIELTLR